MRGFKRLVMTTCLSVPLTACTIGNGRICGPQTPAVYCDREAYERLTHPKGYGEYWIKDGMTIESWRQDWVKCGGMADGGYGTDAPSGSSSATIQASAREKREKLGACMSSKGYHFSGWEK